MLLLPPPKNELNELENNLTRLNKSMKSFFGLPEPPKNELIPYTGIDTYKGVRQYGAVDYVMGEFWTFEDTSLVPRQESPVGRARFYNNRDIIQGEYTEKKNLMLEGTLSDSMKKRNYNIIGSISSNDISLTEGRTALLSGNADNISKSIKTFERFEKNKILEPNTNITGGNMQPATVQGFRY